MEPCPLCFGVILMSDIYHLYFAAKDPWAGSTNLRNDYIRFKRIHINGPYPFISDIQLCIQGFYELSKRGENHVVKAFEKQSNKAIHVARLLIEDDTFLNMLEHKASSENLFDYIYDLIHNS
jgi:tRNA(adenine34) deaminase